VSFEINRRFGIFHFELKMICFWKEDWKTNGYFWLKEREKINKLIVSEK